MQEFQNLYLYLPDNVKTERLLIGEDNKSEILNRILDPDNRHRLLSFIYDENVMNEINLCRSMVYVTDASLHKNGLYIKIEQKNQMRGCGYDNATVELFLLENKVLYCITNAAHGDYTIAKNNDQLSYKLYNYIKRELGEKIKISPLNKELERQIKDKNLEGIFKSKKREQLKQDLEAVYSNYARKFDLYLDNINKIIINDSEKQIQKKLK